MKLDVFKLLNHAAPTPTQAVPSRKGASKKEATPAFAQELEERAHVRPDARRDEHKQRPSSSSATTQADPSLLAHALLAPSASRIDTSAVKLKAAPTAGAAEAHAVSTRAKGHSHQLGIPGEERAPQHATHASEARKAEPETKEERRERETTKVAAAETQRTPDAPTPQLIDAPAPKFELPAMAAPQEAAPLAQLAPLMLDDASVRAVLLPTVARVSMDAGDAGRLNVQLKVNDGVTEIRASGPAAQLLEARQGELKVALAREGLALGQFDLANSQSNQHQGPERIEPELSRPTARRATSSSEAVASSDGHLHVKA